MANKKINQLGVRSPLSLTDLMLVGDPSTGYSYKTTIGDLSTFLETNIALNDLNDVTLSSPTNGQVLQYNGTAWVNATLTPGLTGSGASGWVAYWTGTSTLSGESGFFYDAVNDRMGLGTDNPETTLEVRSQGTTNVRGFQVRHYDNTTAFSQAKIIGARARGSVGSPSAALLNDSLVSFNARGYKATGWSDTLGGLYIYAAENFTDTATGTYITFRGVATGGTTVSEWMRIASTGDVGIGTTTPTSGGGFRWLTLNGNSGSVLDLFRNGTSQFQIQTTSITNALAGQTNLPMTFATNGSLRMQITGSTGNVIIGGTFGVDAGFRLDVSGTARIQGSTQIAGNGVTNLDVFGGSGGGASQSLRIYGTTPNTQGLLLSYDTGSAISYIDGAYHSTASANAFGDIIFRSKINATNTLVENVRIRGWNGNMVLSNDLRLKVTKKIRLAFYDNDTATDGMEFYLSNTPLAYIDTPNIPGLLFNIGGTFVMRLTNTGRVGIGTGSPGSALDVYGVIQNGQTFRQYVLGTGVSAAAPTYSFLGDTNNGWYSPSADVQGWTVGGTDAMRLFSNGNFAVGTTTDGGFKFDCNGTARINGVLQFGAAPTLESFNGSTMLKLTASLGLTISSDRWNSNTSSSSYIQNGYSTKNFVTTNAANGSFNSFDFSSSNTYQPTIAVSYNQKLINGAMTIQSTAVANFFGIDSRTTDNSTSIANNVYAIYGDATLGTNTSANRWAGYFVGNGYFSGSVGIGISTPNASSILHLSSTTKGFLPPVMTGANAEAISTPVAGLLVYANNGNGTTITSTGWWGYDGTTWVKLN